MRSLIAPFLIPLFAALPVIQVIQVFAQATQQQPHTVQPEESRLITPNRAGVAREGEQPRLLAVPTVEPTSQAALLLATAPIHRAFPDDSAPAFPTARLSGGAKAAIVVGVILVVAFVALLAVCRGRLQGCGGD